MHQGFRFSLATGAFLRQNGDSYYLISEHPLRALRLNRSLFDILVRVRDGISPEGLGGADGAPGKIATLRVLFSLTAKGYLRLEGLAEPEDHPFVSIIIPVRDQPEDLRACLESLGRLDYPAGRYEVIVVDDGSKEEITCGGGVPVSIIRNEKPLGPAASRNLAVRRASGEILAFLDADCIATAGWLRETVPFFFAPEVAAVGGLIDGYYRRSLLDRYEAAASSLNMGRHFIMEGNSGSTFYVPTANMLVRRDAFLALGGFREDFRLGEDVDLCWRLRGRGYTVIYAPYGRVFHRHRRELAKMLLRRAQYGTSEAVLYRTHRAKRKVIAFPIYSGLIWLTVLLALLFWQPYFLVTIPVFSVLDLVRRRRIIGKHGLGLGFSRILAATMTSHASFFHFASFHLVRYYLCAFIMLGIAWFPFWVLGGLMVLYTSAMDFMAKKAEIPYPAFLGFYLLEHLAYQLGVLWGCVRCGYFGSYLVRLQVT